MLHLRRNWKHYSCTIITNPTNRNIIPKIQKGLRQEFEPIALGLQVECFAYQAVKNMYKVQFF
jgi:hypothetical protein